MTTRASDLPRPRTPEAATVGNRFQVKRTLHRGSATATMVATDDVTGLDVVVKTARVGLLARGTRLRLLHEAEVLRSLEGPGLVPLVDAGESDGLFYLAMPLVEGQTLAERLVEGPMSVPEALQLATDLLSALDAVHARGILHRDVKPSNLIVTGEPVQRATLIDFGLARSPALDETVRDEPVGTARYISPEQAGLLHREVDERSDLYAAGVVLFEALTGRPPFDGRTVGEVLRQHAAAPAPDPRAFGVDMPAALAQIVQRLLRKDPRDRYQAASGALADIEQLRRALRDGETDPVIALGLGDRRATLTEPAFVGRRNELAQLLTAANAAAAGAGGVVLVEAESGGGKSRLLDELASRAVDLDTLVLRGQGVDEAARRPFEVLQGVARGLVVAVQHDRALRERLVTRLIDERAVLVAALPALREVLGQPDDAEMLGPEEFGEARALAAMSKLLDVVGSQQRAAIVLLDDCQWADEQSVRLLSRWQRGADSAHVLVIAAFRAEEVAATDPLRAVSDVRVTLPPFTTGDVQGLIESMAGRVPTIVVDLVTRLSAGSPFMASAVLRGLVESGALFHDGVAWRTDNVLMNDVRSSREAATFLTRRLELLDAELLGLLAAGAVLGKEFDLDLAAGLVDADTAEVLAALQSLRSRHLVWMDMDELRATFVHDKLREALLDRLSADQRKRLHARAADLLVGGSGSAYDLAYHFHAAGDDRAALPYALAAAEEARSRHALAAAEQQYRIAVGGIDPSDVAAMRDVQTGLGDVLMLRGRYDDAAACFRAAFAIAAPGAERAEIALRLGELTFKRGEAVESVEHLQSALRSLNRWVPSSRGRFLLGAVWEALVQAVHSLLPAGFRRRRRLADAGTDILAARIYSRLAYSYWFTRGAIPCGWAHLREMNLMEIYPPTPELAQAYSEHAPVASTLPWYSRGRAYAQRSLDIRRDFGDVWGQGQSLHFFGVVLYSGSRYEEAIAKLTEAIRLLERTGDQWEINTALWHVGFANYRLGRTEEAVATFQRCLANGREIGDFQAAAIALSGISKATDGNVAADEVAELLDRCVGDLHTTGELAAGEAVRLLAAGEPEAAVTLLTEVRRQIRRAGVRNEYVAPLLPWLLTALRTVAETCAPYDARRRQRVLRRAWRVGWRARSIATFFRNNLPHVLREQAAVALLAGHRRRANRLLRKARRVAAQLGMTGELVQIATVADLLAAPTPTSLPAAQQPEAERTLSLVDRFDTLLRVGRAIASALTPESVYDVVRVAALELLRAEDCEVALVEDGAVASSGFGDALVRQAATTRSIAVLSDDDPSVSMVLGRAKSALAAPIFVRGRIVACWVVVHRQVRDLFGEDERRLAEFISALAGAALENAEGFAEVQGLTQTLERRVDDRTAELLVANTALRATLDELERANDELRRLDELKSDFVAMVSHELRSPLTSVIGYCSTMLRHWDRVDDEKKHSFVEIIDAQSRRLSVLVNDLLEMSRIESGHLDTELTSLPLAAVLDELVREYSDRVELTVSGDTEVDVVADVDHLRRVLINLVDNANKYGAPPIVVEVTADEAVVDIAVRDHGDGVPTEFVPRLFDKFAQASAGSTRRASGTGLGLSIVKGLVEAMSGDVRYEPPADGFAGGFVVRLSRSL